LTPMGTNLVYMNIGGMTPGQYIVPQFVDQNVAQMSPPSISGLSIPHDLHFRDCPSLISSIAGHAASDIIATTNHLPATKSAIAMPAAAVMVQPPPNALAAAATGGVPTVSGVAGGAAAAQPIYVQMEQMSPGGVNVGHLYGGWRSATPSVYPQHALSATAPSTNHLILRTNAPAVAAESGAAANGQSAEPAPTPLDIESATDQLKQLQIVSEAPSAPKAPKVPKQEVPSTAAAPSASKAKAARSAVDDDDAKETVAGSGAVAESQGSASSADTVLCLETPAPPTDRRAARARRTPQSITLRARRSKRSGSSRTARRWRRIRTE